MKNSGIIMSSVLAVLPLFLIPHKVMASNEAIIKEVKRHIQISLDAMKDHRTKVHEVYKTAVIQIFKPLEYDYKQIQDELILNLAENKKTMSELAALAQDQTLIVEERMYYAKMLKNKTKNFQTYLQASQKYVSSYENFCSDSFIEAYAQRSGVENFFDLQSPNDLVVSAPLPTLNITFGGYASYGDEGWGANVGVPKLSYNSADKTTSDVVNTSGFIGTAFLSMGLQALLEGSATVALSASGAAAGSATMSATAATGVGAAIVVGAVALSFIEKEKLRDKFNELVTQGIKDTNAIHDENMAFHRSHGPVVLKSTCQKFKDTLAPSVENFSQYFQSMQMEYDKVAGTIDTIKHGLDSEYAQGVENLLADSLFLVLQGKFSKTIFDQSQDQLAQRRKNELAMIEISRFLSSPLSSDGALQKQRLAFVGDLIFSNVDGLGKKVWQNSSRLFSAKSLTFYANLAPVTSLDPAKAATPDVLVSLGLKDELTAQNVQTYMNILADGKQISGGFVKTNPLLKHTQEELLQQYSDTEEKKREEIFNAKTPTFTKLIRYKKFLSCIEFQSELEKNKMYILSSLAITLKDFKEMATKEAKLFCGGFLNIAQKEHSIVDQLIVFDLIKRNEFPLKTIELLEFHLSTPEKDLSSIFVKKL